MIIPQDVLDRLDGLNIEEVAQKLGMEVKKHKALCFMHNDHDPSISFSKSKNLYRCWVCGKGGGPIKLVQEKNGWTFHESCIWLGKVFGVWIPEESGIIKKRARKVSMPVVNPSPKVEAEKQIDQEIGEWIIEHAALSKLSKRFLYEERKYKPEVVERLRIGSLTYPERLKEKLVRVFGIKRCENSGLFYKRQDGLHLCFKAPCLLFPYYDENRVLYSIQSRYLGEVINKQDRFVFPKGVKQRLFNRQILNEIKNSEPLYVCEGVTDCIALLSSGKKAVAFPSSSICHPEDVRLLSKGYLFMYPDKDTAGEGLFKHLSEELRQYSNVVHRVDFPDGFNDFSDYYVSIQ